MVHRLVRNFNSRRARVGARNVQRANIVWRPCSGRVVLVRRELHGHDNCFIRFGSLCREIP